MACRLDRVVDWDSEARRLGYNRNALASALEVTLRRIDENRKYFLTAHQIR